MEAARIGRRRGWYIYDDLIVKDVDRAAKYLTRIKYGAYAIDGLLGAADTFEAYREGKDWVKVLIREDLKSITDYLIPIATEGCLAAIGLTPIGWGAIVVFGTFEAGEIMVANYFIKEEVQ